jgi:hypothetical protein
VLLLIPSYLESIKLYRLRWENACLAAADVYLLLYGIYPFQVGEQKASSPSTLHDNAILLGIEFQDVLYLFG